MPAAADQVEALQTPELFLLHDTPARSGSFTPRFAFWLWHLLLMGIWLEPVANPGKLVLNRNKQGLKCKYPPNINELLIDLYISYRVVWPRLGRRVLRSLARWRVLQAGFLLGLA